MNIFENGKGIFPVQQYKLFAYRSARLEIFHVMSFFGLWKDNLKNKQTMMLDHVRKKTVLLIWDMDDNLNISDMLHSQIICFCRAPTYEDLDHSPIWKESYSHTKIMNYSNREKHSKVYLILSAHSNFEQLTCLPLEI